VVGRRRDSAEFRPSAQTRQSLAPSRRQAVALLAVVVLVASGVALASYLVRPSKARAFELFYGSVLLNDERAPVAVDLTNGRPTVRLVDANTQVNAKNPNDLIVTPLTGGTLLLNGATGEFNMVDSTGFVIKTTGGGVPLPKVAGPSRSTAVPSGAAAYIEQTGAAGTSVFLVGQTTVQSATGAGAKVRPRASTTMTEPGSTAPGAAVGANGDLWLLVGAAGSQTVRQLSVPHGSDAGATLTTEDHGAVSGTAALGVAARNPDGTGGDVVAVASARSVQLFEPDGSTRTGSVAGLDGVDDILPASNATGSASFLYHSTAGWSLVSMPVDGRRLSGPHALAGLSTAAKLAPPVESGGRLYTMGLGSGGQLWDISAGGARPLEDAATYPVVRSGSRALEPADFADGSVFARGSRVIFNSPHHLQALALFTDGSRKPTIIDKGAAVSLNAAGGATSLTDAHSPKSPRVPPKPGSKPAQQPAQPINNEIKCRTTKQVPHIPTITQATPGSRSLQLRWSYPLLDTQDCAPSTYTVAVKVLSSVAPAPPGSVTVQGQDGVNITGLFPSTQYEVTVTAFINGTGTPSSPVRITTGPEGPAAPTNISVTTDSSGSWHVTWSSCGGIRDGCVPTASWNVVPQLCDGLPGLASPPAPLSVAGDPSQHTFTATYPGNDSLLGHGLNFQILGIGQLGTVGTPNSSRGCAYSWSTPIAGALSLSASQPPNTALGGSANTTVTLSLGSDPVRNVGGIGAQVTFRLTGPTGTQTQGPVTYNGSGSTITATFHGVQAGATYTAQATVSAPRQPSASATVGPVSVTTRADWPALSVSADCPPDRGPIVLTCSLSVTINGLSSADANGERFDLASGSGMQCGSTGFGFTDSNFDPAHETITGKVSLLLYHGSCTVSIALVESQNSRPPLVFGGTVSPTASTNVALGSASQLNAQQSDFSADWSTAGGGSNVRVKYEGTLSDSDVSQITNSWAETVHAPNGTNCGSSSAQPTSRGIDVAVDPNCVNRFGSQTGWSVTVSYHDASDGGGHGPFSYSLTGGPPTYQPCTVAASDFDATWTGTSATPAVQVKFNGDQSALAGCTGWAYLLKDPGGDSCGTPPAPPDPQHDRTAVIPLSCTTSPSADNWSVSISYTDTAGNAQALSSITVTGALPP
jgi:hypothetical protein